MRKQPELLHQSRQQMSTTGFGQVLPQHAQTSAISQQYLSRYKQMHQDLVNEIEQQIPIEPSFKNVWVYNFEEELERIAKLVVDYPVIAMVSSCREPR